MVEIFSPLADLFTFIRINFNRICNCALLIASFTFSNCLCYNEVLFMVFPLKNNGSEMRELIGNAWLRSSKIQDPLCMRDPDKGFWSIINEDLKSNM